MPYQLINICICVSISVTDKKHQCSYVLEGNSGVLISPNYPDSYPNNIDCHWIIHVDVGEQIQLRFNVFSLEERNHTDYIRVFDGSKQTDALLGEFFGYNGVGIKLESSGNRMYVIMHSDARNTEKGFSGTFQRKGESGIM